jgi:ATP-binding cassette subfamily B protein
MIAWYVIIAAKLTQAVLLDLRKRIATRARELAGELGVARLRIRT